MPYQLGDSLVVAFSAKLNFVSSSVLSLTSFSKDTSRKPNAEIPMAICQASFKLSEKTPITLLRKAGFS